MTNSVSTKAYQFSYSRKNNALFYFFCIFQYNFICRLTADEKYYVTLNCNIFDYSTVYGRALYNIKLRHTKSFIVYPYIPKHSIIHNLSLLLYKSLIYITFYYTLSLYYLPLNYITIHYIAKYNILVYPIVLYYVALSYITV